MIIDIDWCMHCLRKSKRGRFRVQWLRTGAMAINDLRSVRLWQVAAVSLMHAEARRALHAAAELARNAAISPNRTHRHALICDAIVELKRLRNFAIELPTQTEVKG